ncbi:hypothetical protein IWT25_01881 [Secundilactobacillus pentosiphilus]|uniref:Uncharacterized protein n=1 Tax=Secundilactobacillus pentosiphilus TaxID=1714682 RepID=A0A1Z5IY09_9LACO|nr:hypothetical protein [Secundilactobacillus pentosiphilus]GAX06536.1 hypothetical protein IWT25_01881 [Secundilactobacillus pentosiphilus]
MTNKRIRKKQLKRAQAIAREGSPQTVSEALAGYVDKQTFDAKKDPRTYLNSLITESK